MCAYGRERGAVFQAGHSQKPEMAISGETVHPDGQALRSLPALAGMSGHPGPAPGPAPDPPPAGGVPRPRPGRVATLPPVMSKYALPPDPRPGPSELYFTDC